MSQSEEPYTYISLQEATKYCPYSQEYLSLRARQGKLKAVKLGRNWFTTQAWLKEYVANAEEFKNNLKNNAKHSPSFKTTLPEPPANLPVASEREPFSKQEDPPMATPVSALEFTSVFLLVCALLAVGIGIGRDQISHLYYTLDPSVQKFAEDFDRGFSRALVAANSAVQQFGDGFEIGTQNLSQAFETQKSRRGIGESSIGALVSDENVFERYINWLSSNTSSLWRKITGGYKALDQKISTNLNSDLAKITSLFQKEAPKEEPREKIVEKVVERIIEKEQPQPRPPQSTTEVERITKIEPIREITRQVITIDDATVSELKAQLQRVLAWRGDIESLQQITTKLQAAPPQQQSAASVAPVYVGSQGIQVGGHGNFESLGISGSAGIKNLGVGESAVFGEDSSDTLTVNATSTFQSPVTIRSGLTVKGLEVSPSNGNAFAIKPYGTGAGSTGEIRFYELAANGSSYVGFKAPDSIASSIVWTLPSADGSSGQVLTTNGSGVLSWGAGGSEGAPTDAQYVVLTANTTLTGERILTGTTNQITITDGGAGGNVTLSLPQDIATASAPQFARMGLGQAAHATDILSITSSDATANSKALNIAHSGAITGTGYGLYVSKTGASTTNVGGYFSATGATNNYGLIVENGNVGIGDTTPAYLLTVGNGDLFGVNSSGYALLPTGASSTPSLTFTGDTNTGLFLATADQLAFSTGGSERMRIDSSGNVGIGTTTPGALLDVQGAAQFGTGNVNLIDSTGKIAGLSTTYFNPDTSANLAGIITNETGSGALVFATSPTISSATLSTALTISGDITFSAATPTIAINNTETLTITDGTNTLLSLADAGTTGNLTVTGTITANGNLFTGAGATTYDAGGAAGITIGSADVTAITLTTDGTGDAEVVLPAQSISGSEILNGTITDTQLAFDTGQNLTTTSTPQFARLGLGIAADATNILTATSASTTNLSKTLNISHTGAITGTGYAGYFSKTGASTTNVGLYATASGATNNYAAIFEAGNVGIGDTNPLEELTLAQSTTLLLDDATFASPMGGFGRLENQINESDDFGDTPWSLSGITVTKDAVTAPNGRTVADGLNDDATGGGSTSQVELDADASETWTFSVWIKNNNVSGATISISITDNGTTPQTATTTITPTSSWKRYSVTHTGSSGTTQMTVSINHSSNASDSFYAWGAQLEQASSAGPFVQNQHASSDFSPVERGTILNAYNAGSNVGSLHVRSDGTGTPVLEFSVDSLTGGADMYVASDGGSPYLWINPGTKFEILGTAASVNFSVANTGSSGNSYFKLLDAAGTSKFQVLDSASAAVFQVDSDGNVTVTADNATTNNITNLLTLDHTTTGTAAANIGTGILFRAENDSGGIRNIAQIAGSLTDVVSGSEDGVLAFFTAGPNGGALAERMRIDSSGNVTLGLNIASGTLTADIGGTGTGNAVCHSGAAGDTDNVGIVDCTSTPSADYAEMYPTDGSLEPGDVVAIGSEYTVTTDGKRLAKMVKSTKPYQGDLLGVVSNPAEATDFNVIGYTIKPEDHPLPIALKGRVLVKVSQENGPIALGDYLTSSSLPGIAMKAVKAGTVIGIALESYEENDEDNKILVFINPHWYPGTLDEQGILEGSTIEDDSPSLIEEFTEKIKQAISSLTGTIQTAGEWVFEKIRTRIARVERLEVVDSRTGDIYCTWLEYGEWVKVRGECGTIQFTDTPIPSNDQPPLSDSAEHHQSTASDTEEGNTPTEEHNENTPNGDTQENETAPSEDQDLQEKEDEPSDAKTSGETQENQEEPPVESENKEESLSSLESENEEGAISSPGEIPSVETTSPSLDGIGSAEEMTDL